MATPKPTVQPSEEEVLQLARKALAERLPLIFPENVWLRQHVEAAWNEALKAKDMSTINALTELEKKYAMAANMRAAAEVLDGEVQELINELL